MSLGITFTHSLWLYVVVAVASAAVIYPYLRVFAFSGRLKAKGNCWRLHNDDNNFSVTFSCSTTPVCRAVAHFSWTFPQELRWRNNMHEHFKVFFDVDYDDGRLHVNRSIEFQSIFHPFSHISSWSPFTHTDDPLFQLRSAGKGKKEKIEQKPPTTRRLFQNVFMVHWLWAPFSIGAAFARSMNCNASIVTKWRSSFECSKFTCVSSHSSFAELKVQKHTPTGYTQDRD